MSQTKIVKKIYCHINYCLLYYHLPRVEIKKTKKKETAAFQPKKGVYSKYDSKYIEKQKHCELQSQSKGNDKSKANRKA